MVKFTNKPIIIEFSKESDYNKFSIEFLAEHDREEREYYNFVGFKSYSNTWVVYIDGRHVAIPEKAVKNLKKEYSSISIL